MKTILKTLSVLVIGGIALTMSSCKKEGCMDQSALNYNHDAEKDNGSCEYDSGNPVTLSVSHMYGTDVMSTDSVYSDSQGTKYKFTRCDFYLSGFNFMDMSMNQLGVSDAVFLVKMNTSSLSMGAVDLTGHVHMMNGSIGLDSLTNMSTDPTTMPVGEALGLQVPSMYWSWSSGYIFFAVEGVYDSNGDQVIDGSDAAFEMHLGMNSYRVDDSWMIHQNLSANEPLNINLELDYSQLFAGFDLATDHTTHTMDNMPLAVALKANLPNFISVN
jgi:hypothetical protein